MTKIIVSALALVCICGFTFCSDVRSPQNSVEYLLEAMNNVLSWQISCRHVFTKARLLQYRGTEWKLAQWRYHKHALVPYAFTVETALPFLQSLYGNDSCCGVEEAERVIGRTVNAQVHAEAALMHWIASSKVGFYFSI